MPPYEIILRIVLQMGNVLYMPSMGKELSVSSRSHVSGLVGENRTIVKPKRKIPGMMNQHCDKAMAVVPD